MNDTQLSKMLAYVLRHAPWEYELELDDEGWVPVAQLLEGLRSEAAFRNVTQADLEKVVNGQTVKRRYEMAGERIRALYGHSIPGKLKKTPGQPPEFLYHGTVSRAIASIRQSGLKPMSRQYIHLSIDTAMAKLVGSRRGNDVIILKIKAGEAAAHQVAFYEGNEHVWLADAVAPEWIIFPEQELLS